MAIIIYHN